MTHRLLLLGFAALISAVQAMPAAAQQSARAAFEDLRNGGYVVVIRHGRTNESPAFPKDESPLDLANCTGQLMLNDAGKNQARAIGAAFKRAEIPVGTVLASGYCRAVEMARLAFGRSVASAVRSLARAATIALSRRTAL
jgi:hypothetical protein